MKPIFRLPIAIAVLHLCLVPVSTFAEDSGVTVSEPNLFSYQAPAGWTLKSVRGAKYKAACDIKDDTVKAAIGVEIDTQPGPLDDWCQQSLAKNKKLFSEADMQVGDQKPFETVSGAKGIRVPITLTPLTTSSNKIQFIDYFFEGKSDAKIAVTCSCPAESGDHYAPLFDAAIKTFVPN
jgi:hypothetical protein